jgi:hypothetical protein
VLVKREVVGFRANIAEAKGEFEEDGEKRYRYRVEPNEMPEGPVQAAPQPPAESQPRSQLAAGAAKDLFRASRGPELGRTSA